MTRPSPTLVALLGPRPAERARWRLRWPSAMTARSSAATRRPSTGASTSAPTRCRWSSGAASRITSSTLPIPTEEYTAARYGRDAAAAARDIIARGRLPILAGGTGFYYSALTRGLFPGPGRDEGLRRRLGAIAGRRGTEFLHRMVARVDPGSAARIQPRDLVRLVRALEVFFVTGRAAHGALRRDRVAAPGGSDDRPLPGRAARGAQRADRAPRRRAVPPGARLPRRAH